LNPGDALAAGGPVAAVIDGFQPRAAQPSTPTPGWFVKRVPAPAKPSPIWCPR